MNKELLTIALAFGCIAANATTNNYDLLGRKGSKMNTPMVYRNVDYSKANKNEQQKLGSSLENRGLAKQAVGLKNGVKAIAGRFSPKGFGFTNCTKTTESEGCAESLTFPLNFGGNNKKNVADYLSVANQNFIYVKSEQKPRFTFDYSYVTAKVTRSHMSGFEVDEVLYDMVHNSTQPSDILKNQSITLAPVATVNNMLHRNYLSKSNVGVYFAEDAVPVRINRYEDEYAPFIIAGNASMNDFKTMPGYEMRAARAYRLVNYFSDLSSVYAVKGRPSNPADASKGPQIYMGLHTYGGIAKKNYSANAQDLDNYIYNNRTVEIVASGNTPGKVSAEGFALNAITVGALDPFTGNEISYSGKYKYDKRWNDGDNLYRKPDFHNYSHFYIDDYDYEKRYKSANQYFSYKPFYEGTETAACVTAGMVSNMLSYNEFYKWHPEVVKAVMMNADMRDKLNYDGLVFNQKGEEVHHSLYFNGDVNTLMKVYNKDDMDRPETQGKKEIRLNFSKESLANIGSDVDGFYISIAWLNSGNDIANLDKLPQSFDIYTYVRHSSADYRFLYSTADHPDSWNGLLYRFDDVSGYSGVSVNDFMVRIVLNDEDTRSENYGQMVLGVDIVPIYYKKR